jgi:hypothetical protein
LSEPARTMTDHVTNEALQLQITGLDKKVDDRHEANTKLLDTFGTKLDTLIELNLGQKLQAQLIAQLSEKSKSHDDVIVEFYRRINKAESTVSVHGWAWRITGTVLIVVLGGSGWLFAQVKDFYEQFSHDENRIATLEFLVQGRTTPVLPPVQTSSGK